MCVCVCVFIKLRITAQSGLVILVILCHSRWSSQGGINDTCYENLWSNATKGTHSLYLYKSYLSPEHLVLPPLLPCCVCVFFPFILDIKFVGRTSRGHIIHLLSAVRALIFLEKDSAIPFPRRPWSRSLCTTNHLIVHHPSDIFYFHFLVFQWEKSRLPGSNSRPNVSEVTWYLLCATGATGV